MSGFGKFISVISRPFLGRLLPMRAACSLPVHPPRRRTSGGRSVPLCQRQAPTWGTLMQDAAKRLICSQQCWPGPPAIELSRRVRRTLRRQLKAARPYAAHPRLRAVLRRLRVFRADLNLESTSHAYAKADGFDRMKVDVVHTLERLTGQPGRVVVVDGAALVIEQIENLRLDSPMRI